MNSRCSSVINCCLKIRYSQWNVKNQDTISLTRHSWQFVERNVAYLASQQLHNPSSIAKMSISFNFSSGDRHCSKTVHLLNNNMTHWQSCNILYVLAKLLHDKHHHLANAFASLNLLLTHSIVCPDFSIRLQIKQDSQWNFWIASSNRSGLLIQNSCTSLTKFL